MFVSVDRAADAVLLAVDTALFSLRHVAIVLGHVFLLAFLYAGFALFEIGGLLRRKLAIFNAFANALLLTGFATIHLIDARVLGIDDSGTGARSG